MNKEITKGIVAGILVSLVFLWVATVDTTAWSRSGSTAHLNTKGDVVTSEQELWFIADEVILTQTDVACLSKLGIENLLLDGQVVIIEN